MPGLCVWLEDLAQGAILTYTDDHRLLFSEDFSQDDYLKLVDMRPHSYYRNDEFKFGVRWPPPYEIVKIAKGERVGKTARVKRNAWRMLRQITARHRTEDRFQLS